MGVTFCLGCFDKQQRIDQLEQENQRLKQQLRYRQRQAEEGSLAPPPRRRKSPSSCLPLSKTALLPAAPKRDMPATAANVWLAPRPTASKSSRLLRPVPTVAAHSRTKEYGCVRSSTVLR